jgi:hypothetical protein
MKTSQRVAASSGFEASTPGWGFRWNKGASWLVQSAGWSAWGECAVDGWIWSVCFSRAWGEIHIESKSFTHEESTP